MAELSDEGTDNSGKLSSEESCSASDGDSEDEGGQFNEKGSKLGEPRIQFPYLRMLVTKSQVSSFPTALSI